MALISATIRHECGESFGPLVQGDMLPCMINAPHPTRPAELPRKVQELIHYEPPSTSLQVRPYGTISRSGYHIEKLTYESESGIIIPSLLFVPDGGDDKKAASNFLVPMRVAPGT